MSVLTSRRFWTAVVDLVVSVTGFITAHFVPNPTTVDIKFIIVALQPVVAILIASYTTEDVATLKYGTTLKQVAAAQPPEPKP